MKAKHIHIHLPTTTPLRIEGNTLRVTRDAPWDEGKHKRDDGGRFATVPGGADLHKAGINHSPAMKHHSDAEAHHHMAAEAAGEGSPQYKLHKAAATAHATALAEAKQRATGFGGPGYENAAKAAAAASQQTMAKKKVNPLTDKPTNAAKQPSQKEMEQHPNYNKEDHEYLRGKGWTNSEIHQRWTAEHGAGKGPAAGKGGKVPDVTGIFKE